MSPKASALFHRTLELTLVCALLFVGACEKRRAVLTYRGGNVRSAQSGNSTTTATTTAAQKTAADTTPRDPKEPDQRYQEVVLPMLVKHGCFSAACHGPGMRGGGFELNSAEKKDLRSYQALLDRINRKEPEQSEIVIKSTRKVPHNGGLNIAEGSCDLKRLLAWIGEQPDIKCSDEPPPDPARFAREVVPAVSALGCVSCHSESPTARVRLDLSVLKHSPPRAELARAALESTSMSRAQPWRSALILAANGEDGKHTQKHDPRSCAYRRLYGWVADAPEIHCELDTQAAPNKSAEAMPDLKRFTESVMPTVAKRGCLDTSCHGGGAGGMFLYSPKEASKGLHEYLMLTARVEDLAKPEESTLLTTARNKVPHGGGERLGGKGDCIDEALVSWLLRRPPSECKPPPVPSFARYVKEIQPVLDRMTCTQNRCHGASLPKFVLKPYPGNDQPVLTANYKAVLERVDLEFMPFSGVQLRMREPCAYAVVGAWIQNKPMPSCVMHDPDPRIFPRLPGDMHPKAKVGPPT